MPYEDRFLTKSELNDIHKGFKLYFCLDHITDEERKAPFEHLDGKLVTVRSCSEHFGIQIEEDNGEHHYMTKRFRMPANMPTEVTEDAFNAVFA